MTAAKESLCLYELKQYKPRLYEKCLIFVGQGNQAEIYCLQDPNETNANNRNNSRRKGPSKS
jgi:hypothetical protein